LGATGVLTKERREMAFQNVAIFFLFAYPVVLSFNGFRMAPVLNSQRIQASDTYLTALPADRLPWSQSVEPSRHLTYMDILKAQLNIIRNLGLEEIGLEDDFAYITSQKKVARMSSMSFKGGNFRKVRLSYFDAGNSVQVLNSLWYPSYEFDSPLLGLDLISIGPGRVMCVCDFQPLYPTPEYSAIHIDALSSIRCKYPDLHGTLSGKIYDDTSFFSKQMLFGRFTDESKVNPVVAPALEEYLSAYVSAVTHAIPNKDPKAMAAVQERQRAYDAYSAAKDPAIGLFEAYFGKDWAHSFVHDFLFDLSGDDVEKPVPPAVHNFQLNKDGNVVIVPSANCQTKAASSPAPVREETSV